MKKIALVAYEGDLMCFSHVMLYAIDYASKGYTVALIIEGAATKLIGDLVKADAPFAPLYKKVREQNLISCICKACSIKMGTFEDAQAQGLTFGDELQGHPSIEQYTKEGYLVLTF